MEQSAPLTVPSLLIWGETDRVIAPERTAALCPSFTTHKTYPHPKGHLVPTSAEARHAIKDFLDRVNGVTSF